MSVTAIPGEGDVRVFADYDGDFAEDADVVVVGSGPTGSVVAHELARAGKKVVMLEEGPPFTPEDFELEGALSMVRTMREGGLRATRGFVMPTMQPIALGGGSLVNSAICPRAPVSVLDDWCSKFDLARTHRKDLDPHYDAVGEFLGIAPTPDEVQGPRNLLFRDGCKELGFSSEPIPRNVRGCRGSGECFTGCRSRAKQSMDISYIPAAIRHGARVLTSTRVIEVLRSGDRVEGVAGEIVEPFTGKVRGRFRVKARIVVLAAGCVATPVILKKSGDLANRSGQVGENLQFHPGVAITGVFPDRTNPQFGATQGYQSLEFIERGYKLETLWAPPAVLAVRTPGLGLELKQRLAEVPYSATWDAIASCHRSLGKVVPRRRSMDPVLQYNVHREDVKIFQDALWTLAQIFFAAGASKIQPGVHGLAEEMHSLREAEAIRDKDMRATDLVCGGNHVFCTTRMHGDPTQGVVNEDGRCHDVDNLYIADTGIFPRCSAVNPMFTAMALAHRQAGVIEDRLP